MPSTSQRILFAFMLLCVGLPLVLEAQYTGTASVTQGLATTTITNLYSCTNGRVTNLGSITATDKSVWTVPAPTNFSNTSFPFASDLHNVCNGATYATAADALAALKGSDIITVDADGELITAYIFSDNYFELYINGVAVGKDKVPFTQFNSSIVRFKVKRPFTIAMLLVDWEENLGLGSENNGGFAFHPGDGGMVAVFKDANNKIVATTNSDWKAQTFYTAPIMNLSCPTENGSARLSSNCSTQDSNNGTSFYALHWNKPSNWFSSNFNDSSWPTASTYTNETVGVNNKPAYTNFTSLFDDPSNDAQFIWSSNIVLDNEVVVRYTVAATAGTGTLKTMLRLPDTGQNTSYTTTFGEDHDYTLNPPFFINRGNGTLTDTVTGLMWQRTDGGEMTFEQALQYCDTLTLGGHTDWRLPSALEAFSILNHQRNNPALDVSQFATSTAEYWWSATVQYNDTRRVWLTNAGGGIGNHLKTETISAGGTKRVHVRAVRSPLAGQILSARFIDNGNGTVTDQLSNLIWQKVPSIGTFNWEQALTFAENLSLAGANDWRVPNIKELQSLNDFGASNPSANTTFFSAIGVKKYWSATSLPNQTTRAWYWDTQVGITTYDLKTANNYLICVRSNKAISTGIRQIDPELESVRISPNPAANEIILYFEGEGKSAVKSMTLSNALGQVSRRINIPWASKTFQINTTALENGWYFLSLQKGEAIKTFKILIQH